MNVLFSTVCPCIDACTYWLVSQCHNITAHKHHVNHVYIMCLYIIDTNSDTPSPGAPESVPALERPRAFAVKSYDRFAARARFYGFKGHRNHILGFGTVVLQ